MEIGDSGLKTPEERDCVASRISVMTDIKTESDVGLSEQPLDPVFGLDVCLNVRMKHNCHTPLLEYVSSDVIRSVNKTFPLWFREVLRCGLLARSQVDVNLVNEN